MHLYVMLLQILYNFICLFELGLCFVKKSHEFKTFLAILIPLFSEEEDGVLDDKEEG